MPSPRVHLLPWDRPLLPQAAAWLAGPWNGDRALDLAGQIVVVPTQQAGRRLRETLAALAADRGHAVFPPEVITPEALIDRGLPLKHLASASDSLLAWVDVLQTIDLAAFTEVFPVPPIDRTFASHIRLAHEFTSLQQTLAENGLRIADVPERAGPIPEAQRWRQLARLETLYDATLVRCGLRDRQQARIQQIKAHHELPDVSRIVLLGTPDPIPLAIRLLAPIAPAVPIDVVVFGPPESSGVELFDCWGRPRGEVWAQRPLDWPDFESVVQVRADPAAQAELIVAAARAQTKPGESLGIGVADNEVMAPLRNGLNRSGIKVYVPDGQPLHASALHHLITLLLEFARDPSFAAVESLTRSPDVARRLEIAVGTDFSPARLLAGLDYLHARHLPASVAQARAHADDNRFPELPRALGEMAAWHEPLTRLPFPQNINQVLGVIFSGCEFDDQDPAVGAANHWTEVCVEVADAMQHLGALSALDAVGLALNAFGNRSLFEPKDPESVDLQGWLELLWEDAPHLVVAGVNDGLVPATITGDPFLPDALREQLGLRCNADRLARDNYLLQALAACRASEGRLDVVFGRTSAEGDPLRPSRVLLQCNDSALPQRVQFLFRDVENAHASIPWSRAWTLRAGVTEPIARIPVTGFRSYLQCPFRFYLRFGRQMEAVDPGKSELDARDFGTLCHEALETMGRDERMRDCTEPHEIREHLINTLEQTTRRRYGADLPLPLLIQIEAARQRLCKAAEVQAQERVAGWRIVDVERRFDLTLNGLQVRGTVDRIDRHTVTGAVRVLDYKTSDKAIDPKLAHARHPRRGEDLDSLAPYAHATLDGREYIWTDLQLPLYRHALDSEFGPDVACAYFNLPKAASETALTWWAGFDDAWQHAALRCAAGVAADVAAGLFWPPAEADDPYDAFATLFHRGTAASVTWTGSAR